MDPVSLFISVGGLLLSIYAVLTAQNVQSAVNETIKKINIQRDLSEIDDILKKLNKAKSAASIWIAGAVEQSQVGRDCLSDLRIVREAEDALAVWVPADMNQASKKRMEKELENLRTYCEAISSPQNNENQWNGVVVSIQSLIRLLREHSRTLENSQLISAK